MVSVLQSTQRLVHKELQFIRDVLHEMFNVYCITHEQLQGEASCRVHRIELILQLHSFLCLEI